MTTTIEQQSKESFIRAWDSMVARVGGVPSETMFARGYVLVRDGADALSPYWKWVFKPQTEM